MIQSQLGEVLIRRYPSNTKVLLVFIFPNMVYHSSIHAHSSIHNMVYHIIIIIFNMISEPKFVLGIKQTSLANKEDSHVHTAIRSHTYLSAGSRLHSISQPPQLTTVSRSSSPSNPCLSLSDLCTSSLRLSKPTPQTCSQASREENPKIWSTESQLRIATRRSQLRKIYHAPPQILDFQIVFVHTCRHDGLLVHRSTWPENLVSTTFACASTRHLGF